MGVWDLTNGRKRGLGSVGMTIKKRRLSQRRTSANGQIRNSGARREKSTLIPCTYLQYICV